MILWSSCNNTMVKAELLVVNISSTNILDFSPFFLWFSPLQWWIPVANKAKALHCTLIWSIWYRCCKWTESQSQLCLWPKSVQRPRGFKPTWHKKVLYQVKHPHMPNCRCINRPNNWWMLLHWFRRLIWEPPLIRCCWQLPHPNTHHSNFSFSTWCCT